MRKSKSGNPTPIPFPMREGRSRPAGSRKVNSKEEQMTPTSQAMRVPVEGLTVVGEAAYDIAPEVIELGFEIHTVGVSAAMAVQENVAKTKHIGQALAPITKAESDIKTGAIEVMPTLQLPNPPLGSGPNPLLLQSAFVPSGS